MLHRWPRYGIAFKPQVAKRHCCSGQPTVWILWVLLTDGGLFERQAHQQPLVSLQLSDLRKQVLYFSPPYIFHLLYLLHTQDASEMNNMVRYQ